ncbi:hypothetical protein NQ318_014417 [Aromia moschata]|uniref:Uncharacterized protein n=1 Tax=Aromia moschata TaxID=1265417 RepID=A0AAV8Y4L3_9CUCU|nr:hypothetical protein NQ318_014417 [Aromia moschata]
MRQTSNRFEQRIVLGNRPLFGDRWRGGDAIRPDGWGRPTAPRRHIGRLLVQRSPLLCPAFLEGNVASLPCPTARPLTEGLLPRRRSEGLRSLPANSSSARKLELSERPYIRRVASSRLFSPVIRAEMFNIYYAQMCLRYATESRIIPGTGMEETILCIVHADLDPSLQDRVGTSEPTRQPFTLARTLQSAKWIYSMRASYEDLGKFFQTQLCIFDQTGSVNRKQESGRHSVRTEEDIEMVKQNCAMMGLQATTGVAGKRKLEAATAPGDSSPAKNGRWEADDCIARLQAVAVPADAWRSPAPSLAATLLTTDDEFDEDEFEDELSDEERGMGVPEQARFTQQPYNR